MPEVLQLKPKSVEQIFPHNDLFLPIHQIHTEVSVKFQKREMHI